jgi:hypothetical protein
MAAIYCGTQKYTVNSGLGIYDLTGSHRPFAVGRLIEKQTFAIKGNGVPLAFLAGSAQMRRLLKPGVHYCC